LRFAVHGPASWLEGSPRCHRPPGGDVPCRVHVGMAGEPTGHTLEHRLALAVVRCDVPARRALLRRVRGFDLLHPTASLVLEPGHQQTPTVRQNSPVESSFLPYVTAWIPDCSPRRAGHASDVEILDADHVKSTRQIGGGLLRPIFSSVRPTRCQPCDRLPDSLTSVRAPLAVGKLAEQPIPATSLTGCQARHVQQSPSGQCRRHHDTPIDPNGLVVPGAWNRIGDRGERDMPSVRSVPGDPVGLHTVRYPMRPPKPDPSDLRHPYLSVLAVQPLNMFRSHPHLPEPFMSTCFAPCRSAVRAVEKIAHGLGEIAQCLLLHRHRARPQPIELRSRFGQLPGLLDVSRRGSASWTPTGMLFHSQVPDEPRVGAVPEQPCRLFTCRQQTVAGHESNVTEWCWQEGGCHARASGIEFLPEFVGGDYRRLGSR
jgi:hypothetical protein